MPHRSCLLVAWLAGCAPSPAHQPPHRGDAPAECMAIVRACHDVGRAQGGEAEVCHRLGHRGEQAACAAERDRCLSLCAAAATH